MLGLDDNIKSSIIVQDINNCVNEHNIAKKMHLLIHIYAQIKEDIVEKTKLTQLRNKIEDKLNDLEFRRKVELFYKLYEGDEGKLIFDDRFEDKLIYQFNFHKEIYKELNKLNIEINFALGSVKRFLNEEETSISF